MMIFWFRYNIAEKGRKVFAFYPYPDLVMFSLKEIIPRGIEEIVEEWTSV